MFILFAVGGPDKEIDAASPVKCRRVINTAISQRYFLPQHVLPCGDKQAATLLWRFCHKVFFK